MAAFLERNCRPVPLKQRGLFLLGSSAFCNIATVVGSTGISVETNIN